MEKMGTTRGPKNSFWSPCGPKSPKGDQRGSSGQLDILGDGVDLLGDSGHLLSDGVDLLGDSGFLTAHALKVLSTNKLASLGATLVRNYDRLTHSLTY